MAKHDKDEVSRKQDRAGQNANTKNPIRSKSETSDLAKRQENNRKRTDRDYS